MLVLLGLFLEDPSTRNLRLPLPQTLMERSHIGMSFIFIDIPALLATQSDSGHALVFSIN